MEITLLKEEDVWGDSALEVIQAYGTRTGISDAAIVLGTFVGYGSRNSAGVTSGCVWTASFLEGGSLCVVGAFGKEFNFFPRTREAAVRPALSVSATSKISPSNVREMRLGNGKTVQICEHGAYPQTVAPESISQELEVQYQKTPLNRPVKIILSIQRNLRPSTPDLPRETIKNICLTVKICSYRGETL